MTEVSVTSSFTPIMRFHGMYGFLSNFYATRIEHWGLTFPHVEGAFVAGKTLDPELRKRISTITCPRAAKKLGREILIREDWISIRVPLMEILLLKKFAPGTRLANMLLATGDAPLIEGNHWGDVFWGQCHGFGENNLGILLMKVRESLRCK